MNVKGKVAIVTGASSGIGLATASLLTQKGARVALVARSKEKLEELSRKLPNSFVVVTDMTKEKEIKEMVRRVKEHFGRIDILVNNAGQGYDALVEKIDLKTYRKVFDLDVAGPLIAMQEVIPIMRELGKGVIINISSGTALMALPGMAGYSSLKRALAGISLTAKEELRKDKISVGVVYPYITETDFEKNTIKEDGDRDGGMPEGDSAGYVAEKILDAIESERAETFAHDWMKG